MTVMSIVFLWKINFMYCVILNYALFDLNLYKLKNIPLLAISQLGISMQYILINIIVV